MENVRVGGLNGMKHIDIKYTVIVNYKYKHIKLNKYLRTGENGRCRAAMDNKQQQSKSKKYHLTFLLFSSLAPPPRTSQSCEDEDDFRDSHNRM